MLVGKYFDIKILGFHKRRLGEYRITLLMRV